METVKQRTAANKIPRELRAIGNLIKTERRKQNLTLSKLSEMAFGHTNYSKTISQIERSKKPQVPFMTICLICKALNI